MESNQDRTEETRIDELDFFGTLAQSYGNSRALDIFQALNDDYTVRLVILVVCRNRKDCSWVWHAVSRKPKPGSSHVYNKLTACVKKQR